MKKNSLPREAKTRQNSSNPKHENKSNVLISALMSALAGIAAAMIMMLLSSLMLSKTKDPDSFVSLCAIMSAAISGFVAAKFGVTKMPDSSRILRVGSVWAIISLVIVVLSLVFPSQIADGNGGGGSAYFSAGILAAILIGAFLGSGKKNKRASKNSKLKRKSAY